MGLKLNSIKLVMEARAQGVDFSETLTLGRQFIGGSPDLFDRMKSFYGYGSSSYRLATTEKQEFAEAFLEMLGARTVTSMDFSDYESAGFVHDLNNAVPAQYHQRFSTVFDTGTLEHVFNFPASIKNCLDMVKVGGHLLLFYPMNNFCGHGFYQFSPELFFRTLSQANGFAIEQAMAFEDHENTSYYKVVDPKTVPPRGKPVSQFPVLGFVLARKLSHVESLSIPQQSAYEEDWELSKAVAVPVAESVVKKNKTLDQRMRQTIRAALPGFTNAIRSLQRRQRLKSGKSQMLQAPWFIPAGGLMDRLL